MTVSLVIVLAARFTEGVDYVSTESKRIVSTRKEARKGEGWYSTEGFHKSFAESGYA